jgi:hypothetical protein
MTETIVLFTSVGLYGMYWDKFARQVSDTGTFQAIIK